MYSFKIKPGQAINLGGATLYCTGIKGGQCNFTVESAEKLDEPTTVERATDSREIAKYRLVADIGSPTKPGLVEEEQISENFMRQQW